MTPSTEHLRLAVRLIVDHFTPLVIIVFGSFARGEAKPGSDLDLLIVLSSVENGRNAAIAIRRLLTDLPVPKDVVVATPELIEVRKDSRWHIVGRALREGRVVYTAQNGK